MRPERAGYETECGHVVGAYDYDCELHCARNAGKDVSVPPPTPIDLVVWRDDGLNPNEQPLGLGWVSIKAVDPPIVEDDNYLLVICHVVCYGGAKAFMPTVRFRLRKPGLTSTCENGDAHRGDDSSTYSKAREQGELLFRKHQEILAGWEKKYPTSR